MQKNDFKTILVIGDNPDEIIKKYSLDTKVDEYVFAKFSDKETLRKKTLLILKNLAESANNSDIQKQYYNNSYMDVKEMSDYDYFLQYTKGCRYDEKTGDAITDKNPNAHYKYEKCYQSSLEKYGEEGTFSNPFILNDGTKSYKAKVKDIDWKMMHMHNTKIYESAWEIVVEGRKPVSEQEYIIFKNMSRKTKYFSNFKSKKDYVIYSCAFWCYGLATENEYKELGENGNDMEWIFNFYDKFISPLDPNTLLTIYEAKEL